MKTPKNQDDFATMDVDHLVGWLERFDMAWDVGHTGRVLEARVWVWPYCVGRYRPAELEPLADMLRKAMLDTRNHTGFIGEGPQADLDKFIEQLKTWEPI